MPARLSPRPQIFPCRVLLFYLPQPSGLFTRPQHKQRAGNGYSSPVPYRYTQTMAAHEQSNDGRVETAPPPTPAAAVVHPDTKFYLQYTNDYFDHFERGYRGDWHARRRRDVFETHTVPRWDSARRDPALAPTQGGYPDRRSAPASASASGGALAPTLAQWNRTRPRRPFRTNKRRDDGAGRGVDEALRLRFERIGLRMVRVLGAGSQGLAVLFEREGADGGGGGRLVLKWSAEFRFMVPEMWTMRRMVGARHIIQASQRSFGFPRRVPKSLRVTIDRSLLDQYHSCKYLAAARFAIVILIFVLVHRDCFKISRTPNSGVFSQRRYPDGISHYGIDEFPDKLIDHVLAGGRGADPMLRRILGVGGRRINILRVRHGFHEVRKSECENTLFTPRQRISRILQARSPVSLHQPSE